MATYRSLSHRAAPAAEAPVATPPGSGRRVAVLGAGIAGIACARTLAQAGHAVQVFEKNASPGGRLASVDSPFGSFDAGAQYFTLRDPRFALALDTVPGLARRWSANSVRVLDATGHVAAQGRATGEAHWVATPRMDALANAWAAPLAQAGALHLNARVHRIERDPLAPAQWQLRTEGPTGEWHVWAGLDAVVVALPATAAQALLERSGIDTVLLEPLARVSMAPCWTLMVAFPQAVAPGLVTLGPQWNVARSTHHRIAWLARESSKPGRSAVERWTIQASPAWSAEHLEDAPARVQAKLLKAFAEVTGIRAEPAHAETHCWRYAQTTHPAGRTHLWDAALGLGACGDWCLGHRVEDAFVSGLEMALAIA